jgi:hypothetical protein
VGGPHDDDAVAEHVFVVASRTDEDHVTGQAVVDLTQYLHP